MCKTIFMDKFKSTGDTCPHGTVEAGHHWCPPSSNDFRKTFAIKKKKNSDQIPRAEFTGTTQGTAEPGQA